MLILNRFLKNTIHPPLVCLKSLGQHNYSSLLPEMCHPIGKLIFGVINIKLTKLWPLTISRKQTTNAMIILAGNNEVRRTLTTVNFGFNLSTQGGKGEQIVIWSNISQKVPAPRIKTIEKLTEQGRRFNHIRQSYLSLHTTHRNITGRIRRITTCALAKPNHGVTFLTYSVHVSYVHIGWEQKYRNPHQNEKITMKDIRKWKKIKNIIKDFNNLVVHHHETAPWTPKEREQHGGREMHQQRWIDLQTIQQKWDIITIKNGTGKIIEM